MAIDLLTFWLPSTVSLTELADDDRLYAPYAALSDFAYILTVTLDLLFVLSWLLTAMVM